MTQFKTKGNETKRFELNIFASQYFGRITVLVIQADTCY